MPKSEAYVRTMANMGPLLEGLDTIADAVHRVQIYGDISQEIAAGIAKHGKQEDIPLGTGPDVMILGPVEEVMPSGAVYLEEYDARGLAALFTKATDRAAELDKRTWANILLEEVFEGLAESDPEKLRAELVQGAAVLVRMIQISDKQTAESSR